ncbi:hypothetical protein [Nocardia brasiliensis]|uniref:hypothetical protein n=1 Tax=Nocardia brasiliensis TaxID=37326 RepID=UPI0004A71576|nr:hypothetical protein [Nocardia brasiliensis]
MQVHELIGTEALRPPRLNFAGWCMYCLERECNSARCIATHAGSVWEVCERCGGSEYVNGHIDPETAVTRCNCFGGVVESASRPVAEVIELRPESKAAVFEAWPHAGGAPVRWVGTSAQGGPVIEQNGTISEVFDINDPEQWF